MRKSPATDAFWSTFRDEHPSAPDDYRLIWFGGGDVELVDRQADLVEHGPKRATTTLLRDFENGKEPHFPVTGDLWLVTDGAGRPRCVIETGRMETRPFRDVDAQFAWDEGEGDRSLANWRADHIWYFTRQARDEGFVFDEAMTVVLERFRVIWPVADDPAIDGSPRT